MNRTGDSAKEFGLYISECCGVEILFRKGDTFCRCPTCAAPCEWEMAEVVIPGTELEEEKQIAAFQELGNRTFRHLLRPGKNHH